MSFEYIDSMEELQEANIKELAVSATTIALDTETTGLDPQRCKLCLIQMKTDKSSVVYIINVRKIGEESIRYLKESFDESQAEIIIHNSKFDLKFLDKAGIRITNPIFDTMLAEQVLVKGMKKSGFSLADVVQKYCGVTLDKTEQTSIWSRDALTIQQLQYAALDVEYLHEIREKQLLIAASEELVPTIQLECDAVKATYKMELAGIKIDEAKINLLQRQLLQEKQLLINQIHQSIPSIKNPQSSRQVLKALQEAGINIESTEKDVLIQHSGEHEVIPMLLQFRKTTKKAEVTDTLLSSIHNKTGRIHADFKQNQTVTGRYSCTKPNLQGIPHDNRFRECFIAEQGNSLVICDYSQMELRIIASIAKESAMIDIYQSGRDIHRLTASIVNGCSYDEVTDDMRSNAKALNFGLIYGMKPNTFANYARTKYQVELTPGEARYQVEQFFKTYKGIGRRINQLIEKVGNTEKTLNGRIREWTRKPPITERANYAVQGTGADILKVALCEVNKKLLCNPKIHLVSTIHDEIILEVPDEMKDEVAIQLKFIMEDAGRKFIQDVPIIADVSIGKDWSAK